MGKYCLLGDLAKVFKQKLKSGELNPEKLAEMTSKQRRKVFSGFLDETNAKNVNALFEKKLLQKNRWNAIINWAKETTGIKPEVKRDMVTKIEKMVANKKGNILDPAEEKLFMQDLASSKLGVSVTSKEAKEITKLTNDMTNALKKHDPKTKEWKSDTAKYEYGLARVKLLDYVGDLKKGHLKFDFLNATAGTMKSLVASLDNSFFGRQGIKVLYTKPGIWTKNFVKSFGDITKALGKKDAMTPIKADVFSRKYAMDGTYEKMGLDVGISTEEAFPSSLPEKIPILGRLYKASEVAFNGAALRMRSDMADVLLDNAVRDGIDITDKKALQGMGTLINSMTGRGSLGKAGAIQKELNVLMFSAKFLKSNFDTLTAHVLDKKATSYSRKIAAKNLLKITASITGILTTAEMLNPGSVDYDPRSTNFGKIKIGNTKFDVSGGMGSMVTLASRIIPSKHEGEWGWWSKSGTSGEMTKLKGGYGGRTPVDVIEDYLEGKASPILRTVMDLWNQEFFGGEPWSLKGAGKRAITPISLQTWEELQEDPNSANNLASIILEGLGISANNFSSMSFNHWEKSESKQLIQFEEKIGTKEFKKANEKYNKTVEEKLQKLRASSEFKSLSRDNRDKVVTKLKKQEKDKIFKEYKFKYKQEKKDKKAKETDKLIKKLSK